MSEIGKIMLKEIHEIPSVLTSLNKMKEIHEIPSVLTSLNKMFTKEHPAVKQIRNLDFRSVIILARGTSDNAAHFLKYLIEVKMGLPCGLASPSAATLYHSKFNYRDTLVVALSQSGQSTDLLTFAKADRKSVV